MTKPHQSTQSQSRPRTVVNMTKDDEAWIEETIPVVLATTNRHNGKVGEWRRGYQLANQIIRRYADTGAHLDNPHGTVATDNRIKRIAKKLADEGKIARRNGGKANVEYADKDWAESDAARIADLDARNEVVLDRLEALDIVARRTYPGYSLSLKLEDVERLLDAATTPTVLR